MRIFLDAGHGGIEPGTGKYVTAPNKQYKHARGTFHRDGWFYEGVFNRAVADLVHAEAEAANLEVVRIYHDWQDVKLRQRTTDANAAYYARKAPGVLLSIHANAAPVPGVASGFEVFHFPGSAEGQRLASLLYRETMKWNDVFPGRGVKQANFHMLRASMMPAALVECGFFDNYTDAMVLMDLGIQKGFARAFVRAVMKFFEE